MSSSHDLTGTAGPDLDERDEQHPGHHDDALGAHGGPVGVSVVHDVRAPAIVGVASAVLTVVWFARALGSADPLDWAMCLVPALVGLLMLLVLRDSRAPLLVADDHGVRMRDGVTWTGLRWTDVERVELLGRSGLRHGWRDGALLVHLAAPDPVRDLEAGPRAGVTPAEPRTVRVPLGLGTRVQTEGLTGNLVEDLDSLAAGLVPVVVLADPPVSAEPAEPAEPVGAHEDRPAAQAAVSDEVVSEPLQVVVIASTASDADLEDGGPDTVIPAQPGPVDDDVVATQLAEVLPPDGLSRPAPTTDEPHGAVGPARGLEPGRAPRAAARADVVREGSRRLPDAPAIPAQRGADPLVVTARIQDLDDVSLAPVPAPDPVIGPVVAAARQRARLSIDTLSERTRIRPHVLECLEVDDFEACGGDFYARGHLRTLARTFGLDAEQLVASYDARYASPEIEAKQVFEAELASGIGGGVRAATHGPRWSLLAASVLLLVGIWGAARIFSDDPQELVSPAPDVVDTAGLIAEEPAAPQPALGSIEVTADGASPQVAIRDGAGRILFADQVADGRTLRVVGTGPFDVTASNGQAVRVTYLGEDLGTVGDSDQGDARRFG